MITKTRLAAGLLLFSSTPILSELNTVQRCVDPQGAVTFQQTRCEHDGSAIDVVTVEHGWTRLRSGELDLLEEYQRQAAKRYRGSSARNQQRPDQRESKSCFSKRTRLEKVRAKLRRGYKAAEGGRLRRQREEYQQYLALYCGRS